MEKQTKTNLIDISIEDGIAYIVDKKFIDIFLKKFSIGTLDELKTVLKAKINTAETKEQMFELIEVEIYLSKIANHENFKK